MCRMSRRAMRPAILISVATACVCAAVMTGAGAEARRQSTAALPEGPGREIVQGTCARCHGLNMISGSWGNTQGGWKQLFSSMVTLPPDQADVVAAYLATHFPPRAAPAAVVIPGPANVSFKEWVLPTLGSRPHDPLAAADGSIWWTGMFSNV